MPSLLTFFSLFFPTFLPPLLSPRAFFFYLDCKCLSRTIPPTCIVFTLTSKVKPYYGPPLAPLVRYSHHCPKHPLPDSSLLVFLFLSGSSSPFPSFSPILYTQGTAGIIVYTTSGACLHPPGTNLLMCVANMHYTRQVYFTSKVHLT